MHSTLYRKLYGKSHRTFALKHSRLVLILTFLFLVFSAGCRQDSDQGIVGRWEKVDESGFGMPALEFHGDGTFVEFKAADPFDPFMNISNYSFDDQNNIVTFDYPNLPDTAHRPSFYLQIDSEDSIAIGLKTSLLIEYQRVELPELPPGARRKIAAMLLSESFDLVNAEKIGSLFGSEEWLVELDVEGKSRFYELQKIDTNNWSAQRTTSAPGSKRNSSGGTWEILVNVLAVLVGLITFVGIGILFPLWAAKEAEYKGLTKISKIAKTSIYILMGSFGGLAAVIASANKPYTTEGLEKKQQNSRLDSLMRGGLMITAGILITVLGFGLQNAYEEGTQGVLIIEFIPIPISAFPLLTIMIGVGLIVLGLRQLIRSLKKPLRGK